MKQSLNEPNDLCLYYVNSEKYLLICDTNNHRILSINLATGVDSYFNIYQLENNFTRIEISDSMVNDIQIIEETLNVFTNQSFILNLHFNFVNDLKAEKGAKHKILISSKGIIIINILW